ncbi:MAG: hypothetical protein CME66_06750 [Halobacteriovoraceae bacterium]|jgi:PAS domain S-box-containing protein|nr:hypothetical protein [Halobacteriovoraceae bacterium]
MSKLMQQLNKYSNTFPFAFCYAKNDKKKQLEFINDKFLEMTGYAQHEVLGKNCNFLQGELTDQTSIIQLKERLSNYQACLIDLINYKKSQETFWNRLLILPYTDKETKEDFFLGFQHDVTVLKPSIEQITPVQRRELSVEWYFLNDGQIKHAINNPLAILLMALNQLEKRRDQQSLDLFLKTKEKISSFIYAPTPF